MWQYTGLSLGPVWWISLFCSVFLLLQCGQANSQPDHLESLSAKYSNAFNTDGCDYGEPTFLDYVINRILPDTSYQKYITDRTLLHKLKTTTCLDTLVEVSDELDDGRLVKLSFKLSRLDTNQHDIVRRNSSTVISIDGKVPYGGIYWNEKYIPQHLESVSIQIGETKVTIPKEAFSNLFNPNTCRKGGWDRPLEVYTRGDCICIYIYGGNAADTYFAKMIFEADHYVATLVADYGPLPCYGCFRPDFPGF